MKGLSVMVAIALLVFVSQLATCMKKAAVLTADPALGVRSLVLDSTFDASSPWNHTETTT